MGRKPTKNINLPKGMRARKQRSGKTYYYLDTGATPRHEIPLGDDYVEAVQKWAKLTIDQGDKSRVLITFRHVAERYQRDVLPTKAPRTQKDNLAELAKLLEFFDDPPAPLDRIEPHHIREYLDWRSATAKVRANREKALFSHIWNFARDKGITALPNPCRGVKGFSERGRKDVYIEDEVYAAVHAAANQSVKDAMDLAYLTGQRPADVLRMHMTDIRDDLLTVRPEKVRRRTGISLRIRLTAPDGARNELGKLVDALDERKRGAKVHSLALVTGRGGSGLTASGLDNGFERAREKAAKKAVEAGKVELAAAIRGFQFRDLRAKAGTEKADSEGILEARRQLGHASVKMTERYVRKGNIVSPTK